ncbi:hypothetical protein E5Q_05518 [Mixia osmundae IAM 14324]|uniref:RRM domain-containing protein n=1 Tax=Mixia osmundae (strain CBS 9802 / IAM 14324 / JCM 22182 / KY 12970) TaxID=764103 RepID=G7E7M0_MIXOS|nr:hypothetical protein E5Q_05518 [Mixia osmundae IAM 14324]
MSDGGRTPSPRRDRSRSPARAAYRPMPAQAGGGENPGNNLHVSGLSNRTEDRDLEDCFAKFGRVQKSAIMRDPHTKESRGFAFVTMESADEAAAAIDGMNATELHGRMISVALARRGRARTPTPGAYHGPPKRDVSVQGGYGDPYYGGGGYHDRILMALLLPQGTMTDAATMTAEATTTVVATMTVVATAMMRARTLHPCAMTAMIVATTAAHQRPMTTAAATMSVLLLATRRIVDAKVCDTHTIEVTGQVYNKSEQRSIEQIRARNEKDSEINLCDYYYYFTSLPRYRARPVFTAIPTTLLVRSENALLLISPKRPTDSSRTFLLHLVGFASSLNSGTMDRNLLSNFCSSRQCVNGFANSSESSIAYSLVCPRLAALRCTDQ